MHTSAMALERRRAWSDRRRRMRSSRRPSISSNTTRAWSISTNKVMLVLPSPGYGLIDRHPPDSRKISLALARST